MSEQKLLHVPEEWSSALVIAAHPDDIEYGLAGAVSRWTSQGKTISYLMVTDGEAGIDSMPPNEVGPLRRQEELASAAKVGVTKVDFLGYTDGVIEYGLPLRRDLARHIRQCKPEVIVTSNFDLKWGPGHLNMADHRVVGLATLDAARDADNRWIFPELLQEGYEPWHGIKHVFVGAVGSATHAVDTTDHIDNAVASLQEHKAYIANLGDGDFDPDTFLRFIMGQTGERLGCDYAVAIEVYDM